jgi:hypothetical protein
MSVPQSIDELSTAFLSEALASASGGGTVVAVRADDIGAGVGVFGIIARLHLTWVDASAGAPSTVIAKMPTTAEANRNVGHILGLYSREHHFYETAAHRVSFPVPTCYFNAGDAEAGTYLLLLEDLVGLEMGDQLAGLGAHRAERIVEQFAAFHSQWWETPELDELDWLPHQDDALYLAAVPPIVSAGVAALGALEHDLPPGSMDLARRVDASFVELTLACAKGPRTFVHGDARLDNLFFTPGTHDCTVIDWQLSMRCRGVADIVWLLATSMDPDVQNASVDALLDTYQRSLARHGVTVSAADLRRAAAEHAGYLLSGPLSLIGTFDFAGAGDGRAAVLTQRWVQRGFNLALLVGTADVLG